MNKSLGGRGAKKGWKTEKCGKRLNGRHEKRKVDPVWYHAAAFVHVLYRPTVIIIMRKLMNPIGLGAGSLSV